MWHSLIHAVAVFSEVDVCSLESILGQEGALMTAHVDVTQRKFKIPKEN